MFVVSMRILCENNINEVDIRSSHRIITEFLKCYENLYGEKNMKYNVHCHIHLPMQVFRYHSIKNT